MSGDEPRYNAGALADLLVWAQAGGDASARLDITTWARRNPVCGTTLCLAGQTVVAAGWEVGWYEDTVDVLIASTCSKDGRSMAIRQAAQETLGINSAEAYMLFGMSDYHTVNTSEEAEAEAVAFLAELLRRAVRGLPHLEEDKITRWRREHAAAVQGTRVA